MKATCSGVKMDYSISKQVENASMRVVSLGAGVQSTVMLLMALHREIKPIPDVVIFADTGFEPLGVYDHLNWIEAEVAHLTNGSATICSPFWRPFSGS